MLIRAYRLYIILLMVLAACTPTQEVEQEVAQEPVGSSGTATSSPTSPPPTSTGTPTEIPLPTHTPSVTLPPTPSIPMLSTLGEDILCRFGPGEIYSISGSFFADEVAPIIGRSEDQAWYVVEHPRMPRRFCWLNAEQVRVEGDLTSISIAPLPENIVIGVSVELAPTVLEVNPCVFPASFDVSYTFEASGPLTITYRRVNNESVSDWKTIKLTRGGSHNFREVFEVDSAGGYFYRVEVSAPNVISGETNAQAVCP